MASGWPHVVWAAVRRRWVVVLVVFVAVAGFGAVSVTSREPDYVATGVMSFQPREGEVNGRDLTSLLVSRYPAVVRSSDSLGTAATASGVSGSAMSSATLATVEPATLNLVITVSLGSPEAALAGAQSLYLSTLRANASDPYLQAVQVQPPTTSGSVVGVSSGVLIVALAVLSALLAVAAAVAFDALLGVWGRRRSAADGGQPGDERPEESV